MIGHTSYACVVIGSGPGGYVAAIRAAQLGMRTAVVERGAVGGRCLNQACIPAKAVLRAADVVSEVREAGSFGVTVSEPVVDFAAVVARRTQVVQTLTSGVSGLMAKNGIDVIAGTAGLTAAATVTVDGTEIEATTAIVLATGSTRRALPGLEFGGNVIGTEEAWALTELPATMVIVGAGASGVELASAYQRLGTQVTLYEGLDRVLPTEDADSSRLVERGLRRQGVEIRTDTRFDPAGRQADWVVIAAGRGPDVAGLGLDAAGVALTDEGLIAVDGAQRTSVAKFYAIGDLVAGPALAHKASEEGVIAVEDAAGLPTHPLVHPDIPRATFCAPGVASFGLTEAQARAAGHDVVVGKVPYGAVGAGAVLGDRAGLVKIVATTGGELLGGHVVGSKATELIQELVTVRHLEGSAAELARIVHGHPTLSEAVLEAARAADGWLIHG